MPQTEEVRSCPDLFLQLERAGEEGAPIHFEAFLHSPRGRGGWPSLRCHGNESSWLLQERPSLHRLGLFSRHGFHLLSLLLPSSACASKESMQCLANDVEEGIPIEGLLILLRAHRG